MAASDAAAPSGIEGPPLIVFPAHPAFPRLADPAFETELAAAQAAGFEVGFAGLELLFGEQPALRLPPGSGPALYRGWMLRVEDYARLEAALGARGYRLVNSAAAYQHGNLLPEWYASVGAAHTPRSIWIPGRTFDRKAVAKRVGSEFGDAPVVLKDYVKSRKHEWFDACFIRSASDEPEVERVVGNFLRLTDDALVGGLVFREFVEFKRIGLHAKSRMPLVREYRFFVLDGEVLARAPYWGEGSDEGPAPEVSVMASILPRVQSRFFAIDVAQKEDGAWLVVELNDGGCAGLPDGVSPELFYAALRALGLASAGTAGAR